MKRTNPNITVNENLEIKNEQNFLIKPEIIGIITSNVCFR